MNRFLKLAAGGTLMVLGLFTIAGGCVVGLNKLFLAMEMEEKPNEALLYFGAAIIIASAMIVASRALTREDDD